MSREEPLRAFAMGLAMLSPLTVAATPQAAAPERCHVVRGRYTIFADGDALRIAGSRYRITVVIDALDRALEKRGWERTRADGVFTLCTRSLRGPLRLDKRDVVTVRGYRAIRFVRS